MRFKFLLSLLALLSFVIHFLNAKVINLTPNTFSQQVESPVPTLVAFIAPWCGHCQRAKPEIEKAAASLGGVVHVAVVDCEEHKELAGQHGIRGFPTIKMFSEQGKQVDDYNGARTAQAFSSYAMSFLNRISDPVKVIRSSEEALRYVNEETPKLRALLLTSKSSNPALFKSLAIEFSNKPIEFATIVDAENYADALKGFGVEKFPTLLFLKPKGENEEDVMNRISIYDGNLKKYDIASHIEKLVKETKMDAASEEETPKTTPLKQVIQKVKEVTSQEDLDSNCEKLCVLGLLQNNDKKELFQDLARNHNEQGFPFLLVDAINNKGLSKLFEVEEEGDLTIVALRLKRKKFVKSANIAELKDAESFLDRISYGDVTYKTLKNQPKLREEL